MASTRNRNTVGNYCLEEINYKHAQAYTLYPHSQYGTAYETNFPGVGFLPAQIPSNKLSSNAPDIESFLFGINSTNLVNPAPAFTPEINSINSINLFKRDPTFLPEPLVIQRAQRPFPIP